MGNLRTKPTYDDLLVENARLRKLFAPPEVRWASLYGFSKTEGRMLWLMILHDVVTYAALERLDFPGLS